MDGQSVQFGAGRASGSGTRPASGEAVPGAARRPGDQDAARQRGRKVLVVDDNVDAANTLLEFLLMCGHDARVATDGMSAIREALAFCPELVLLDVGMPAMDGFAVAERLRAEPTLRSSILIALTGFVQERDVERSRQAGFDHHLPKPLDFRKLMSLLEA
jgi:CheY-like chemotaxis protein